MARRQIRTNTPLDREVIDAIKRLALSENPASDIQNYSVMRDSGPTRITVTFFTDDQFDIDPEPTQLIHVGQQEFEISDGSEQ